MVIEGNLKGTAFEMGFFNLPLKKQEEKQLKMEMRKRWRRPFF